MSKGETVVNSDYFYFHKKYKTYSEKKKEYFLNIKQILFAFISRNKHFEKRLNPIDKFNEYRDKRLLHLTQNYYSTKLKHKAEKYLNLKLPYISFFEVIEIDKFDHFKKILISRFSSIHSGHGKDLRYKDELIEKLSGIKINLDSFGYGQLINLNFKKNRFKHSDLIDSVNISYLKTKESYFILHLEVSTSDKFKKFASKIFESSETSLSVRHFNSFENIFKYRIFNSHTSFKESLTRENIDSLISDLQFQIKYNILKPLRGYFYTSEPKAKIPRIEHYTIKHIKALKENNALYPFFNFDDVIQFTSLDELVDIYINETNNRIHVIKEEGHGKKLDPNDHSDYDRLESHFLIQSMAFPCVFESILNYEFARLNHIKRKMYDFLENSNKWSFFKYFFIFRQNSSYIRLKKEITKLNLITNRYNNEFNEWTVTFLINQSEDVDSYQYSKYNRMKKEKPNLLTYFIKKFNSEITRLSSKKDSINEVFKNMEQLNSYRTNFILQVVSLMIGILAFIFAFDKVKDFFMAMIKK